MKKNILVLFILGLVMSSVSYADNDRGQYESEHAHRRNAERKRDHEREKDIRKHDRDYDDRRYEDRRDDRRADRRDDRRYDDRRYGSVQGRTQADANINAVQGVLEAMKK